MKQEKVYFCGAVVEFAHKGQLKVNEEEVNLTFSNLSSELEKKVTWEVSYEGYTFVTYKGKESGDNYINILKDNKPYITNLGYQSVRRIVEAKKWSTHSKLHRHYLKSVDRIKESSKVVHKGNI